MAVAVVCLSASVKTFFFPFLQTKNPMFQVYTYLPSNAHGPLVNFMVHPGETWQSLLQKIETKTQIPQQFLKLSGPTAILGRWGTWHHIHYRLNECIPPENGVFYHAYIRGGCPF